MSVARSRLLPLALAALLGCTDGPPGLEDASPPSETPRPIIGGARATADLAAGTLTFEPLSWGAPSRNAVPVGPSAIYGNQGVTVRLYNSPVTITSPSSPGKKTFSAPVGLENLLSFPIGDEQAGATPVDTMGIFVFLTEGPTVTGTSSPCVPSCTVTALNYHGTLAFSALGQRYWHWPERVGATGGTDTTLVRRPWTFEADTQVTSFTFDVLVAAAWPPPNDTRWKIDYQGDSVPNTTTEPRWRRNGGASGTIALNVPSAGIVTIAAPAGARLVYIRDDSVGATRSAYIEARLRTNTVTLVPEVAFGMDDDARFIGVGLSGTQVGFLTGTFTFLGTPVDATTLTFHTYQIRKFGADSVQLWMDGTRIASRPYAALSASLNGQPHLFFFGSSGTGFPPFTTAGVSSSWEYVIYEIGASQP